MKLNWFSLYVEWASSGWFQPSWRHSGSSPCQRSTFSSSLSTGQTAGTVVRRSTSASAATSSTFERRSSCRCVVTSTFAPSGLWRFRRVDFSLRRLTPILRPDASDAPGCLRRDPGGLRIRRRLPGLWPGPESCLRASWPSGDETRRRSEKPCRSGRTWRSACAGAGGCSWPTWSPFRSRIPSSGRKLLGQHTWSGRTCSQAGQAPRLLPASTLRRTCWRWSQTRTDVLHGNGLAASTARSPGSGGRRSGIRGSRRRPSWSPEMQNNRCDGVSHNDSRH